MPAILRIFLYQTDASLTVIGSTDPYDQGADLVGWSLQNLQGDHLEVDSIQDVHGDHSCEDDYEVEPYVVSRLQYENVPIA